MNSYEALSTNNRHFEREQIFINKPVWQSSGYALFFNGNQGFIHGSGWTADSEDFPNGTRIVVKTEVHVVIPDAPEPLPEWKPLQVYIDFFKLRNVKRIKLDTSPQDGDAYILFISRHTDDIYILTTKNLSHTSHKDPGYRLPTQEDREILSQTFVPIKRGNHVVAQRYKTTDYRGHEWGEETFIGTIIDFPTWHTVKILTTDGQERIVYRGHVYKG